MAARTMTHKGSLGRGFGDKIAPYQKIVESISAITYTRSFGTGRCDHYVSPQVESLLGMSPDEFMSEPDRWLDCVHPSDRSQLEAAMADAASTRQPFHAEYRMTARDGRVVWVRDMATVEPSPIDGAASWIGVVVDITTDKDAELHLHRLAYSDPLTGLPNRRSCMDRLRTILAHAERADVALLFLDLDQFKVINDGIGHAAGDDLLVAVARRLAPHVAAHGSLARFGGDEFVAVIDEVDGLSEVETMAETLLAALRRPFSINGYDLIVGGSIGIAISAPGADTPKDLLRGADVALYRAKASGGDAFAVLDPRLDLGGLERLEHEAELRQALERREFELAYQPVVDIASGRILAVEALLRWRHPQRGVLPPAAFIPLADETGLIVPLGQWVIEEACRQVRDWQVRFPAARSLQVSVNLSGRQFRQTTLHADVARALGRSGLSPQNLALELKEGDALSNAAEVASTLKAFKQLGVKVTIDDFGKGWSALTSLTQFTIDDLKIDGSCVSRLGANQGDAAIVRALVSMAKAVGLDVTAGAVETDEQLALLRELGCDRAQGHHFAPPLTVNEIEQIFQRETDTIVLSGEPLSLAPPGTYNGKGN